MKWRWQGSPLYQSDFKQSEFTDMDLSLEWPNAFGQGRWCSEIGCQVFCQGISVLKETSPLLRVALSCPALPALLFHSFYTLQKKYFRAPFLVLQLVTNRGLVPVPGRTNQYLEGPQ